MPNKNFMSQLAAYETELLGAASTDVDDIWDLKLDLGEQRVRSCDHVQLHDACG